MRPRRSHKDPAIAGCIDRPIPGYVIPSAVREARDLLLLHRGRLKTKSRFLAPKTSLGMTNTENCSLLRYFFTSLLRFGRRADQNSPILITEPRRIMPQQLAAPLDLIRDQLAGVLRIAWRMRRRRNLQALLHQLIRSLRSHRLRTCPPGIFTRRARSAMLATCLN
jgi:hypothetical protein